MSAHQLFDISNLIAVIGWLSLIAGALPINPSFQRYALRFGGRVIPILLSVAYLWLLIAYWGSTPNGGYGNLDQVAALFASPGNLTAGWIHFLAFDLFVGRWMIDEVEKSGTAHWRLIMLLPITFLIGPVGLLLHFALKSLLNKARLAHA
ncbi:ABA4-like family protein [Vibrio mexicanus]|uniref:ABA4-like family protein n=1 Tax=Vibrio mexicanus TaxID=1004326 RepID=UPI00069A6822|nr:ABA4-like family protein [Vibrio mexicanus]